MHSLNIGSFIHSSIWRIGIHGGLRAKAVGLAIFLLTHLFAGALMAAPALSASNPVAAAVPAPVAAVGPSLVASAAVPASSSSPRYVPIFKPYADDVSALFSILLKVVTLVAFIFLSVLLYRQWRRDPLIIEPFDVPSDLSDLGLTGTVLSQQFFDAILDLQRSARPDDGQADISFIELPRLQVDLQLPGMSWSVRSAIRYFKHALGRNERRIVGEVFKQGKAYSIRVRSSEGRSVDVPVQFHNASNLSAALKATAEAALPLTNPLEAASIFITMETKSTGYKKTLAAIKAHIATSPARQHQDAYVIWASVLRNMGDLAGMDEKLAAARGTTLSRSGRESKKLSIRHLNFLGGQKREARDFLEAERLFLDALRQNRKNIAAQNNLGLLYWDMRRLDKARKCFLKLVAMYPKSSRGYRGLGLIASRQGDFLTAIRHLNRAVDLAPLARWPRINLIESLRQSEDLESANTLAQELHASDPEFAPQYRFRARIDRDRGDLASAKKWLEQGCKLDSLDAWTFWEQAVVERLLGDFNLSHQIAQQVIRLRPKLPDGYRCAAQTFFQQANYDACEDMLEKALACDSNEFWTYLDKIHLLSRTGKRDAAFKLASKIAERWPNQPEVVHLYAILSSKQNRENTLATALERMPYALRLRLALIDLLRQECRFDEAIHHANLARDYVFQPVPVLRAMADIMLDQGKIHEAEEILKDGLRRQRTDAFMFSRLGSLLISSQRYDEALALCAEAQDNGTNKAVVARLWANALEEIGDNTGAIKKLLAATATAAHDESLLIDLANIYKRNKRIPDALKWARQATVVRPAQPKTWFCLARTLRANFEYSAAEDALEKALSVEPDTNWVIQNYCIILMDWNRPEDAIKAANSFLEKYPRATGVMIELAEAQLCISSELEARNTLRKAIQGADPISTQAEESLFPLLMKDGNFDAAEKLAYSVLDRYAYSRKAKAWLADVARERRQKDAAIQQLVTLAKADAPDIDAYVKIREIHEDEGDTGKAREILEDGLKCHPHSWILNHELFDFHLRNGDLENARPVAKIIGKIFPKSIDHLLRWADALVEADTPALHDEALSALKDAHLRQPENLDVLCRIASHVNSNGDKETAVLWLRKGDALVSGADAASLLAGAEFWLSFSATQAAATWAKSAIDVEPNNPLVLRRAAAIFEKTGQLDEATAALQHAVSTVPVSSGDGDHIHLALAHLCEKSNRLDAGIEACERVLKRSPGDIEAQQLLGRLKQKRESASGTPA